MKKLLLSIVASVSLTGCFTTEYTAQTYQPYQSCPQPQNVYIQQAPQPKETAYERYVRSPGLTQPAQNFTPLQTQPQNYEVYDYQTHQYKSYEIRKQ